MVWANIRSNTETYFKKQPVALEYLPDSQKVLVDQGVKLFRSQVLERKEEHTHVEFGKEKESWWLITDHWDGL